MSSALVSFSNMLIKHLCKNWTHIKLSGKHVRQYHDDNGKPTQDYFLGLSPPPKVVDPEFKSDQIEGKEFINYFTTPEVAGPVPYYSEIYGRGTTCDINGQPRYVLFSEFNLIQFFSPTGSTIYNSNPILASSSTLTMCRVSEVRFYCADDKKLLMSIKEPATCSYIVNVNVPTLCAIPQMATQTPDTKTVVCQQVLDPLPQGSEQSTPLDADPQIEGAIP